MRQGVIELAAHVRFFAVSLDDATLGASGGVTGKLRFADAFLTFDPSFYVGFNDRERGYDPSGPYNTEALYLPLRLSYQIGPAVTPFVSLAAGVKTADPDGSWLLLGGAGVDVAITSSVDLGAELMVVLDSGWPLHPTAQWSDFRTGILRVAVRF
jgi:hypothetical protein